MPEMYSETLFIFFIFSFAGWLIELVFRSVYEKRIVNPGFHKGPWLPIYGVTGLLIVIVSGVLGRHSIILRLLFYFILCSGVELVSGIFLERVFGKRYWDYHANRFNILGYICPLYSCLWMLICIIVDFFLLGRMFDFISMIKPDFLLSADILLLIVFSADFLISSGAVSGSGMKLLKKMISFIDNKWKHG